MVPPVASGIVSFADLTLGDKVDARGTPEAAINRSEAYVTHQVFRFSGQNSHTNPIEGLMLRDDFLKGMSVVEDLGQVLMVLPSSITGVCETGPNFP